MSRLAFPVGALLLAASCQAPRDGSSAEPAPPAGEVVVNVPVPAAESAPASTSDAPPATLPVGYRPEYHPAARSLIERMEEGLRPLEAIPSRPTEE